MESNILVVAAGMHSTIQDLGRKGYRSFGIPISGAMDKYSAILANKLLNNEEGLPVMEISIKGPKLFFEDETLFVITGANMSPLLNDMPIQVNSVYAVKTGDVLSFGDLIYGSRAYLGVRGGFKTETVYNSYSYYPEITKTAKITKGDRLQIANYSAESEISLSKIKTDKIHFTSQKIEVTKGPGYHYLTKKQKDYIFSKKFEIDVLNNRMGYQLKNTIYNAKKSEIITSAVIPGTVQLTPSGKLIILMRDCQTTGGYYRILQLTDMAINQLAQKKAGDSFKFVMESSYTFLNRLVGKWRD